MPVYSPQEMSKIVFGRQHAITIWSCVMEYAVEPPEPFKQIDFIRQLEDSFSVPTTASHKELSVMRILGVVAVEPRQPGQGIVYTRKDSTVWPFIAELTGLPGVLFGEA